MRDSEAKKRQLEESLDAINEEVASLRAAGTKPGGGAAGVEGGGLWGRFGSSEGHTI